MPYSVLPASANVKVRDDHWDELRAAMNERNAPVDSPILLPTDMDTSVLVGKIAEYQLAVKELVDCTGRPRCWADTEANGFLSFITGATAGGKKNVFERALAGGASTDFTVDWTDKLQILHWNESRSVLNLLLAVKVENLAMAHGGGYLSKTGAMSGTFAAARTDALTGLNGGDAWVPSVSTTFGRFAEVTANPDPVNWEVSAVHIGEWYDDTDTSFLTGLTINDAWVLVEKFAPLSGATYHTKAIGFKIQVGVAGTMNDARTGLSTSDAADISGFVSPNSAGGTDVWVGDVDPSWINQGGDTRVSLVYTDDPTADDATWTDSGKKYANCYANLISAWLIVELGMGYGSTFRPEVFDPEVFA